MVSCGNIVALFLVFAQFWCMIYGHGKMVDPPARNTVMNTQRAGKYLKQCDTGPVNWSDKANFCGGKGTQEKNKGKCSACGDDWAAEYPRKHDLAGTVVRKITPVRAYLQGQIITVKVYISASHLGYFEFRLCPKLEGENGDDVLTNCYNDRSQYRLLEMTDGNTRYGGITRSMLYTVDLQLPQDVNCAEGCNLQWWYRAGNSWGCDADGKCGSGKGHQEHFVNCADILILNCDQYLSGNYPDWCGYGPTDTLKNCAGAPEFVPETNEPISGSSGGEGPSGGEVPPGGEEPSSGGRPSGGVEPDETLTPDTDTQWQNGWNDQQQDSGSNTQNTPENTEQSEEEDGYDNWSPETSEVASDNTASITCETCYSRGQSNCDACCVPYMTTVFRGTTKTFDNWCVDNCRRGFCPGSHCKQTKVRHFRQICDLHGTGDSRVAPTCEACERQGRTTCENRCCEKMTSKTYKAYISRFNNYCKNNCALGHCPQAFCYEEEMIVWTDICEVGLRSLKEMLRNIVSEAEEKSTDN